MAAPNQPIITTLTPDQHAHFNGCDMYKDGRESPSITANPLFKLAVRYLVERPNTANRSGFVYTYAELTKLEDQVLPQGLPAEKISILHVPGVGLFPDNFKKAIHDSGYTPSSLSRDIISYLLPISTGDPGTRTKYPQATIIDWRTITLDLSPIGYEGITVSYIFNDEAKTIRIIITIQNNVPNSDSNPIVIDSTRSYTTFDQMNHGIDYLRAGNSVKNAAILAAAATATNDQKTALAIIEIMKYLIGKALGDTLQAIELYIASVIYPTIINNQNTCGFTTDRVLTSRYKSVNQSVCLQIGKESGLREVLLYRAGTEQQMRQQIKENYKAKAIKNNDNVIFVIRQAYILNEINVSGNTIPMLPDSDLRSIFNDIITYIQRINDYLHSLNTTNDEELEDKIRMKCAACTASHVFKPGTNKLINIKDLFYNLSFVIEELGQVAPTLKQHLGFGGSFSEYIYSKRNTRGGNGKTGKGTKKGVQKANLRKSPWSKMTSSISSILRNKSKEQKKIEKMKIRAQLRESRKIRFLQQTIFNEIEEQIRHQQTITEEAEREKKYITTMNYLFQHNMGGNFIKSFIGDNIPEVQTIVLSKENKHHIRDIVTKYFSIQLKHTQKETVDKIIDVIVEGIISISEEEEGDKMPNVTPNSVFNIPIMFEDSHNLIILIICSIINLCKDKNFITKIIELLSSKHILITTNTTYIEAILSSEFIEPIYYNLYSRFYFYGYAYLDFHYIQFLVKSYIYEEYTEKYLLPKDHGIDNIYAVSTIVKDAFEEIQDLRVSGPLDNILTVLKQMAITSELLFPEIGYDEDFFSDPQSITATFRQQPFGGSNTKSNKKIHNKKLKNTHKLNKKTRNGNNHRKTYKKI
jgi:hypothetical protein